MKNIEEMDESVETDTCPECLGVGHSLGTLGVKEWFRCRRCGIEFAGPIPPIPQKEATL